MSCFLANRVIGEFLFNRLEYFSVLSYTTSLMGKVKLYLSRKESRSDVNNKQ
jgi:hypothetical protein